MSEADFLGILNKSTLSDSQLEAVSMHSAMRFQLLWEAGAVLDESGELKDELLEAASLLFIFWSHIKFEKRLGFIARLSFKRVWQQVEKSLISAALLVETTKRARTILEEKSVSFGLLSASAGKAILRVAPTLNQDNMRQLAKQSLYDLGRMG